MNIGKNSSSMGNRSLSTNDLSLSTDDLTFKEKLALFKEYEISVSAKSDVEDESCGMYDAQENTGSVLAKALIFDSLAPSIKNRKVSAGDEFEVELKLTASPSADENEYEEEEEVKADNDFDDIDFELLEPTPTSIPALSIKDAYVDISKKPERSYYQLYFDTEVQEDAYDVHVDFEWDNRVNNNWDQRLETILKEGELCAEEEHTHEGMVNFESARDRANEAADSFAREVDADGEDRNVVFSIERENEMEVSSVVEKNKEEVSSVLKEREVSVLSTGICKEVRKPHKRELGKLISQRMAVFEPGYTARSV
ncbi:hypothetical protein ElyMa_005685700 [Elysia marginata]|uniref:Uncharacterized protein n=1 Tax=Elysia marginata TaxID=1093978 RepID=A0AAV4FFF5_9GAST|nr:hypothetical protein ElyMa_005685700 [Elysia marginata]